jgi:hypothetical protein
VDGEALNLFHFKRNLSCQVVAVAHAPSDPYGPYWVRDGRSLDDVLLLEQDFRTPSVLAHLEQVKSLAASLSLPFVLVGDFNSPSQLDWTPVVVHKRGLRYSVLWPLGTALAQAGASDVFRLLHPDPVAQPGYTWFDPFLVVLLLLFLICS